MKNIAMLVRTDLRVASRSVISLIVLFGVAVIPSFFGWFNVISSWDPFGNVKDMTVAVANADEGYKSDLIPMRVNIGEQVISTLRANTDLNWVFTSEKEAIHGTESEKYYAAIVLPPDFSRSMMTFLAPGSRAAHIDYYTNEKKNALSPKITGEAATEVSTQIDQSFTKTLNQVGLSVISSLVDHLDDPQTQAALMGLESDAAHLAAQLRAGADTAAMFTSLIKSSEPLVNSASSLLESSAAALQQTNGAANTGTNAANSLKSLLGSATSQLGSALSASAGKYQALAKSVDSLYASIGTQARNASAGLNTLADQVDPQIQAYQKLRQELQAQADATQDPALHDALHLVITRLDDAITKQIAVRDGLRDAAAKILAGNTDAQATRGQIAALANTANKAIQSAHSDYTTNLKPKLDQLAATLSAINSGVLSIEADLADAMSTLSNGSGSLLGALTAAAATSASLTNALSDSAQRFDELAAALHTASETGDFSEVAKLIGANPDILAGELTTPVGLTRIPVFKVDTFGAQMAPFYTVLGLWVGALLLSVLIAVEVVPGSIPFTRPLTLTQEYIGRYGIFALLGFFQSSLLYLGLIGFVGVRPVYPFLLILAGWVMSFVFTMITYTLVVSFGELGKALAVVLLVIQISAGGGAYPLSVLPQWFQSISPFLPVSHATNAVRSAIAGIYNGDYWIDLGWLLLFIVPTLLLGLVLRRPLVGFNKDLTKALESTRLM